MTGIVTARGLVKRYDGTLALGGLDLDIAAGEIFGLVGPNGAGKTTTLRILATLLVPTAGDAEVAGASIRRNPEDVRRVLGYMPDSFGVYDDMKVWEYLDFFGRCHGLSADQRRRMIGDLLELVDLGEKRDAYVATLSRGMQQRLCLAHALVHDPAVLILDEPASGLDPRARVELRELLRELRSLGKTILISSHILPELEELCTSLAIIDGGRLLAQGSLAEIEARLRVGAVLRIHVLGDAEAVGGRPRPPGRRPVRGRRGGGRRRPRGDRVHRRRRRRGTPPGRRHRGGHPGGVVRARRQRPRGAVPAGDRRDSGGGGVMRRRLAAVATGAVAVGSKELRGRMRGPRAFIALTLYLALLAGFTVMIYLLSAQSAASQAAFGGGNPYASASVGQAVFTVLLFLQVLLVVFLAPAATSGAISLEREKQTLDLLTATPVSTLGIVVGKLASALAFVFVLILASIPLTAVVFVFGGVGPEDILRGYVVLLVTALGFGSVGILLSCLTRRTQSATVLTYLAVLVLTVGTGFTWFFWDQMAGTQQVAQPIVRDDTG